MSTLQEFTILFDQDALIQALAIELARELTDEDPANKEVVT